MISVEHNRREAEWRYAPSESTLQEKASAAHAATAPMVATVAVCATVDATCSVRRRFEGSAAIMRESSLLETDCSASSSASSLLRFRTFAVCSTSR